MFLHTSCDLFLHLLLGANSVLSLSFPKGKIIVSFLMKWDTPNYSLQFTVIIQKPLETRDNAQDPWKYNL